MTEASESSDAERRDAANKAARAIARDFDRYSPLRDKNRAGMVALLDPDEIVLKEDQGKSHNTLFAAKDLRGVALFTDDPDSPFDDYMEEVRERFAERSEEGHYVVKFMSSEALKTDKEAATKAASSLILETKILSNLQKHPHIAQVHAMNADGHHATFGTNPLEGDFFAIVDKIKETLADRMLAWREKKGYNLDRMDDLATRQSQVTQRLEVALDVCSAMTFLSSRKLVYILHPQKVGFDSRYERVKLFCFGDARESGEDPYFDYVEHDMQRRAYVAPEVLQQHSATESADVYAFGMLLWETMTLKHPFDGMDEDDHLKQVVEGRLRPPVNRTWPEALRKLMENCWRTSSRPSMADVYSDLENSLLFQGLDGIDQTEDHARNKEPARPKGRKIKYQSKASEMISEERDRDTKSVRSKESHRSRESARSRESNRSRDSGNSKEGASKSRRSERSQRSVDAGEKSRRSERSQRSVDVGDKPSNSRHRRSSLKDVSQRGKTVRRQHGKSSSEDEPSRSEAEGRSRRSRYTAGQQNPDENEKEERDKDSNLPSRSTRSKKIKYRGAKEQSAEERDRDTKSVRSRESVKSRESTRSRESARSRDSARLRHSTRTRGAGSSRESSRDRSQEADTRPSSHRASTRKSGRLHSEGGDIGRESFRHPPSSRALRRNSEERVAIGEHSSRRNRTEPTRRVSHRRSGGLEALAGAPVPDRKSVVRSKSSEDYFSSHQAGSENPALAGDLQSPSDHFDQSDDEPGKRKPPARTTSGLLQPAAKDTGRSNVVRPSKEKTAHEEEARAQQRKENYRASIVAATQEGQRIPAKRRTKPS